MLILKKEVCKNIILLHADRIKMRRKAIHRNKNYVTSFVLGAFYSMNVLFKKMFLLEVSIVNYLIYN